jgi:hypothetical protein
MPFKTLGSPDMLVRSLGELNLYRSWARVLHQARRELMDVPDRLPFEVAARFWGDNPTLRAEHHVRPSKLVMATKLSETTVRPFVRIHPADFLLYQALVDECSTAIEAALGPRTEVFAYRVSSIAHDDPFEGSPRWVDFKTRVEELCLEQPAGYVLEADVASYFVGIEATELERRLFEIQCPGDHVRDLGDLLRTWNAQGIAGLPQGVGPSSVLANFYLSRIDDHLRMRGLSFARYMDDLVVVVSSHHEAREILDEIEQRLFEDGLSLGSKKTRVLRSESVLRRSSPEEQIEEGLEGITISEGMYAIERDPTDEELDELRSDEVTELYNDAIERLRADEYPRAEIIFALRFFTHERNPEAISSLEYVLLRMPGLTAQVCRYLEAAVEVDADAVAGLLSRLVVDRFHRPQEWINLLRVIQVAPMGSMSALAPHLAQLAQDHPHELVRARAIVAWGRQTDRDDFAEVDQFVARERVSWMPYAMVAIQSKSASGRNRRYEQWGAEGRALARLGESLRGDPIAVAKI